MGLISMTIGGCLTRDSSAGNLLYVDIVCMYSLTTLTLEFCLDYRQMLTYGRRIPLTELDYRIQVSISNPLFISYAL